ncbi:hypothetical protein EVG20_g11334 [Dentipellis fragilis]|uniref:Uncharacterized protein n=1 Tax=Dentipellis fragilis TaxID=205917 RepID=A0A4Y9XQH5_9AGAM|nr:hypothetical protein EVG20_g11334 [Dentipellis fragilis]
MTCASRSPATPNEGLNKSFMNLYMNVPGILEPLAHWLATLPNVSFHYDSTTSVELTCTYVDHLFANFLSIASTAWIRALNINAPKTCSDGQVEYSHQNSLVKLFSRSRSANLSSSSTSSTPLFVYAQMEQTFPNINNVSGDRSRRQDPIQHIQLPELHIAPANSWDAPSVAIPMPQPPHLLQRSDGARLVALEAAFSGKHTAYAGRIAKLESRNLTVRTPSREFPPILKFAHCKLSPIRDGDRRLGMQPADIPYPPIPSMLLLAFGRAELMRRRAWYEGAGNLVEDRHEDPARQLLEDQYTGTGMTGDQAESRRRGLMRYECLSSGAHLNPLAALAPAAIPPAGSPSQLPSAGQGDSPALAQGFRTKAPSTPRNQS